MTAATSRRNLSGLYLTAALIFAILAYGLGFHLGHSAAERAITPDCGHPCFACYGESNR